MAIDVEIIVRDRAADDVADVVEQRLAYAQVLEVRTLVGGFSLDPEHAGLEAANDVNVIARLASHPIGVVIVDAGRAILDADIIIGRLREANAALDPDIRPIGGGECRRRSDGNERRAGQ